MAGITIELVESLIGKEFRRVKDLSSNQAEPEHNLAVHLQQRGFSFDALEIRYTRSQDVPLAQHLLKALSLSSTPPEARDCFIVLDITKL